MAITAKRLKITAATEITATANIATAAGRVMWMNLLGTTGDETAEIVDAASGTTPVKYKLKTNANKLTDRVEFQPFGLPCATAIRIVIAGTGPEVHVGWVDES